MALHLPGKEGSHCPLPQLLWLSATAAGNQGSSVGWPQSLFRALWRMLSKEVKQRVGMGQLGNKYYCILQYTKKRIIEAAKKNEMDYGVGNIPTEWEAWIRRKRNMPPTLEEILQNEKDRQEIKRKSKDFYEKEKLPSKETSEEPLPPPVPIQIKGDASALHFGKEEPSVTPTSTEKTFQPGSWMPLEGKHHSQ